MRQPSVAFFAMPQAGHFEGLRPLVSGLAGRGLAAHVFTHRDYRGLVERSGARFVDLFSRYSLERADSESHPAPCRFVSFAGRYAGEIVGDLQEIRPSLVVHDQHAVIGAVVGAALGIPYVTVCPAHGVTPARLPELLASLPEVRVSPSCHRAVSVLQERFGSADASPFWFASGLSPFLNVYGEPAVFLSEADRRALEPVAFHGCLPSAHDIDGRRSSATGHFDSRGSGFEVYASFGTVVWRYWPGPALDALSVISDALASMAGVRGVISLGGAQVAAPSRRALEKPNVSVTDHLDQWQILQQADAFVTHHGLKSTHESIIHGVPMLSYPLFWDQPALADRCQALGLALPLAGSCRAPLSQEGVRAAVAELRRGREALHDALATAREWELEVIEDRESVLDRIVGLIEN